MSAQDTGGLRRAWTPIPTSAGFLRAPLPHPAEQDPPGSHTGRPSTGPQGVKQLLVEFSARSSSGSHPPSGPAWKGPPGGPTYTPWTPISWDSGWGPGLSRTGARAGLGPDYHLVSAPPFVND